MELKIIGSGSSGNCYLLEGIYNKILIECGLTIREIRKSIGTKLSEIDVCLISHEHMDHAKAVNDILKLGIDIFSTAGTLEALGVNADNNFCNVLGRYESKEFVIKTFATEHDTAEPCGFIIFNKIERKKIVFLTDSYYTKYVFSDVDYFMLEFNYQEEMLLKNEESGLVPRSRGDRVRLTHMELKNALKVLETSGEIGRTKVIPIHMSKQNITMDIVGNAITKAGFECLVDLRNGGI